MRNILTTKLLTQYNFNKRRAILATQDCYSAFKTKMESAIKKQDCIDDMLCDSTMEETPYVISGNVAVIDFKGMTVGSCSELEEMFFGLISLQDFCEDLTLAVNDENITSVVINFDSGGGYTSYGDETCDLIQELKLIKPIYAYSSGFLCSMAYKVACNCNEIIASPTALVGSIGTYCEYITYNGASELSSDGITVSKLDAGITVTTFQGGTEKTIGSETIALSKEQKALIQADILKCTDDFRNLVKSNRGDVKDEFMQGQPFYGKEAIELGTNLIDGCINSLSEFVQLISETNN